MGCGLGRCTDGDVLMGVQFINGGHTLKSGLQFEFPKHLAVTSVECAQFPVACSRKQETACSHDGRYLRKVTPGIMDPLRSKLRHFTERNLPPYSSLIQIVCRQGCPGW